MPQPSGARLPTVLIRNGSNAEPSWGSVQIAAAVTYAGDTERPTPRPSRTPSCVHVFPCGAWRPVRSPGGEESQGTGSLCCVLAWTPLGRGSMEGQGQKERGGRPGKASPQHVPPLPLSATLQGPSGRPEFADVNLFCLNIPMELFPNNQPQKHTGFLALSDKTFKYMHTGK